MGIPPTLVFLPKEFHGQRSLVYGSIQSMDLKESDTIQCLTLSSVIKWNQIVIF